MWHQCQHSLFRWGLTPRTDISNLLSVLTKPQMCHHISQDSVQERYSLFLLLRMLLILSDGKIQPIIVYAERGTG